ncbi:tetratricopeptide repeat protein [Candidatus Woesearchaeota archaeon]|nr:tetratricopeptide repeat protein [Candidatus Woesearchaeota archaeon]
MKNIVLLVIGLVLVSVVSAETAILGLKTTTDNVMENPDFYFSLGKFLAEKGYLVSAEKYLLIGLGIEDDAVARHNLGVVYYEQGKLELAEQEFGKATEVDSDYGKAYYSLGLLLAEQGRNEEALVDFVMTAELEPENCDAFFNAGIVLGRLNRLPEAKEYFAKAVEINPEFAEAKQNLEFLEGLLGF